MPALWWGVETSLLPGHFGGYNLVHLQPQAYVILTLAFKEGKR